MTTESRPLNLVQTGLQLTEVEPVYEEPTLFQIPILRENNLAFAETYRLPNGVPIVTDDFARDTADMSAAHEVYAQYLQIMALPTKEERRARWDALSPVLASFARHGTGFQALEMLYTLDGVRFDGLEGYDDSGTARKWYEVNENARAVRERLRITQRIIDHEIAFRLNQDPNARIDIASIASGSARGIITAIANRPESSMVYARMVDKSQEALDYSEKLAVEYGIRGLVETVEGNVVKISDASIPKGSVDIVEAVGILDYLPDGLIEKFLKNIKCRLKEGGVVIASNIIDNHEREFLHTAVGWGNMYYRTPEQFSQLFLNAGFSAAQSIAHMTPNGIYVVMEARA